MSTKLRAESNEQRNGGEERRAEERRREGKGREGKGRFRCLGDISPLPCLSSFQQLSSRRFITIDNILLPLLTDLT
jgi:hypothetical protein